jgi:hypothetical protein
MALEIAPVPPLPSPVVIAGELYSIISRKLKKLKKVTDLHIRCLVDIA